MKSIRILSDNFHRLVVKFSVYLKRLFFFFFFFVKMLISMEVEG